MRNAIIDSHKREHERRKAEAFEREELERLERIVNSESYSSSGPNVDDLSPRQFITPITHSGPSRDEERKRIEAFYHSKLKAPNQPNDDGGAIGAVNTSDVEKQLESHLGPGWKKKFDPIRKVKYFHNEKTGEVKLITNDILKSYNPTTPIHNITANSCVVNSTTTILNSHIISDNTTEQPKNSKTKPLIAIKIKSKTQNAETSTYDAANSNDKVNKETPQNAEAAVPIIGGWEIVKQEESAFNLPVYTEHPPPSADYDSNEDDLSDPLEDGVAKPMFMKPTINSSSNKNGISFSKRDVSVIKRPKKLVNDFMKSVRSRQFG